MYIPPWPCPTASQFRGEDSPSPFPTNDARYFYVARNGIYHLFRSLAFRPDEEVLVPNYHSGNETSAIRAAGATMRFYPIHHNLQPDRAELERLCGPQTRALYIIHFMGWPQPMDWIVDFCRTHGLLLIEDCALSFLSEWNGKPLGSFGDYSVYCLYKTLPLPNGAVLQQNNNRLEQLSALQTVAPKRISVIGRSAELILESLRSRFPFPGAVLAALKAELGNALTALSVERERVGNIGFDLDKVDTGMSTVCQWLLRHLDYAWIRNQRRANFLELGERLRGKVNLLPLELTPGVCPLFFPILVDDKRAVSTDLRRRGIGVVEFWNQGDPEAFSDNTEFLRRHVLELPIHQNVTPAQLEYIAREVTQRVRPADHLCLSAPEVGVSAYAS